MEEDLTAFLNTSVGGEIHWRRQPILQKTFPYINMSFIASPTEYNVDGKADLQEASIQIDAWAETYIGAVTLARSVSSALEEYSGLQGGTYFQGIFKEGEFDRSGELLLLDGSTRQIDCRSGDYRIAYSQS